MTENSIKDTANALYRTMRKLDIEISNSWQYTHKIQYSANQGIRDLDSVYNLNMQIQKALALESRIIELTTSYMKRSEQRV